LFNIDKIQSGSKGKERRDMIEKDLKQKDILKDKDGRPLPPKDGKRPPEPPKDKDGKPLLPPKGKDGRPLPPPDGKRMPKPGEQAKK
jgi:hypothetical protein